jgi:hypothetical protein
MPERLRGRAGVKQRDRRLRRTNYLCELCLEKGITREAKIVDHKIPLAFGGTDDDENTQNLCNECNDFKTAYESASSEAASFHPDWLEPSAVPLGIVCGPPCSGKTTYVAEHRKPEDIVVDLDTIMMTLDPSYRHWTGSLHESLLLRAIRVRNALLGSLQRRAIGRAWFIITAPTEAERKWWQGKLGGEIILLHPGIDECKRRAVKRGTPLAREGIERWDRSSRTPWQRKENKPKRQKIGADGWPVEA